MFRNRQRYLALLFILVMIIGVLNPLTSELAFAKSNDSIEDNNVSILLVYDYRNYFADLRDSVTTTRELFGHFNVTVSEIEQSAYQSNQLDQYDMIVMMGMQGIFSNEALIDDLLKTEKKIMWIGKGVETLLNRTDKYHFEYAGPFYDFSRVSYKGESHAIGVKREFSAINVLSDTVEVYSWLHTGAVQLPFILEDENMWYVSRIDLNEPLIFIFADVLFELLPPLVEPYEKVYIRIEDVHPFRDTEKLKEIADYLYSKNIPFMVGLIPAHRVPDSRYITEMDEVPEFVDAIQYMQDRGGSIILHGYTHTVFGSDVSGEGFEYWDGNEDKPLERDIDAWVRYTIGRGVKLSVENEIYPLGFEAPHYAMSQDAYISLKKYFSTYSGQIQSSDWGFSTSVIPYEIRNTRLFHKFLPESLGYIDPFDTSAIDKIKNNYHQIKIVRHYLAGVFYHPYLDIDHLKELVEFLEEENVEFYDMKQDTHWVKFDDYEILNDKGELTINYPDDRSDPRKFLRRFFNGTTVILISVLGFVIYSLSLIHI